MHIIDYAYRHGTEKRDGYIAIPELHRTKSSVLQFIKLANLNIELWRPTAFLYIDGFSRSPSEHGLDSVKINNHITTIKSGSSYIAHEWVYTFKNQEYLTKIDIMSGTCAASIQAIYEANRLLQEGSVQEVIIIGGERIVDCTIRVLSELGINIACGDGFVYMKLEKGSDIQDIKWKFEFSDNPFVFTEETLNSLKPDYAVDYVKLHGTGTTANENAEAGLAKLGYPLRFKHSIGHTQGISALLETCMVLEDSRIKGNILVTANGMGGYYGSFTLKK